jgi:predicted adenine nucleotide alpha hydrolase (AANH) superfamily ATPase
VPSVFISYSSNDLVKVERLAEALRQEQDIKVWVDTTNIYPGDDFLEEMKEGIRAADKIIICLSPSFNEKPPVSWVKKELKMAILREGETGKGTIIPVRIKSGGKIPEEIGTKAYADLSTKNRWNRNLPRLIEAIRRPA